MFEMFFEKNEKKKTKKKKILSIYVEQSFNYVNPNMLKHTPFKRNSRR